MIVNPIIPIWIMVLICIILIIIKSKNKFSFLRKFIIVVLLFMINLRIMKVTSNVKKITNNLDVLFVIDTTISMLAEDYSGNEQRFTAVKEDCEYIIDKLGSAKFSIISFNNNSQIVTPYTTDVNMTIQGIKAIKIVEEAYAKGTSMNVVKEDIIESLKKSYENSDRKRIVFFISDGEITNEDELESFSETKKYIDGGAVLGYGTENGGPMKVKDTYTNEITYLEDDTGYPTKTAVSKIDTKNLEKIADDMGIEYINMSKQSNVNSILSEIKKITVNNEEETTESYEDMYYIFAIPLALLLAYEFISYKRETLV